jgi:hypothetical protein
MAMHRLAVLAALVLPPASALAVQPVDIELVLAVDVSGSVDVGELERTGLARAFQDPVVVEAIRALPRRLAVAVAAFARGGQTRTVVGWRHLTDAASRARSPPPSRWFAPRPARLRSATPSTGPPPSSAAIAFAGAPGSTCPATASAPTASTRVRPATAPLSAAPSGRWQRQCCSLQPLHPHDFRGDAAWTDSPAVACAATSGLWRRDSHIGSVFATVSTAASIMGPFFTPPRCSLRMRWRSMAKHATTPGGSSVPAAARPFSRAPPTKSR